VEVINMSTTNNTEYTFSAHAVQRYVERVIGKDSALEINTYIAEHGDKIRSDLNKMIKYGTEFYRGKNPKPNKLNCNDVILMNNGSWVLVVSLDNNLITLFKVDLGVDDEELNKAYVSKLIDRYQSAKSEQQRVFEEKKLEIEKYNAEIKENDALIQVRQNEIATLQKMNTDYKDLIKAIYEKNKMLSDEADRALDKLVTNNFK
jgi:hypothetical protein